MSNFDSTPGLLSAPSNTLTAFYEDRDTAEEAVQRLVATGMNQASNRLVEGDDALDASARSRALMLITNSPCHFLNCEHARECRSRCR